MRSSLFRKLHAEGLISDESLRHMEAVDSRRLFSVYWELRSILYIGVLLLTSGLGILVYKHIDTIGHQAVLAFIAAVSAGSFFYGYRKKAPFSREQASSQGPFFEYILLLGCLTLLIFLGYWQYEYDIFGEHYGTATFIPMVLLFFVAYYFDHLGALSLAITNLAAWLGIAVTPLKMIKVGAFGHDRLIFTGIFLGVFLLVIGRLSLRRRLKPHFEPIYTNFGLHLFFIACLAGLFRYDHIYLLWWLVLALVAWFLYTQAYHRQSFYFIMAIFLYTYIGLCYVILQLLSKISAGTTLPIYLALLYFICSGIGIARLLIHINRQLHAHDRL